jgi:hypothetical protein
MQFIQSSIYKANNKTEPECLLRSFMPDEYRIPKEKQGKYEIFCAMGNLVPLPKRYHLWKLVPG